MEQGLCAVLGLRRPVGTFISFLYCRKGGREGRGREVRFLESPTKYATGLHGDREGTRTGPLLRFTSQ